MVPCLPQPAAGTDEVFVRRSGAALAAAALAAGDGPTALLPQAPAAGANAGRDRAVDSNQPAAAAGPAVDPDQTVPISRPAGAGSRCGAIF